MDTYRSDRIMLLAIISQGKTTTWVAVSIGTQINYAGDNYYYHGTYATSPSGNVSPKPRVAIKLDGTAHATNSFGSTWFQVAQPMYEYSATLPTYRDPGSYFFVVGTGLYRAT